MATAIATPIKLGRPPVPKTDEYLEDCLEKDRDRDRVYRLKLKQLALEGNTTPLKIGRPKLVRTVEEMAVEKERKKAAAKERYYNRKMAVAKE